MLQKQISSPLPPSFWVEDLEAPPAIVDFRSDYAGLENASEIQEHTLAIRACMRRTVEEGIEIGKHLTAVKSLLPHGQFRKWLDTEVGMSYMAATRFMNVYELFGKRSNKLLHLPATLSVAYEIASPSFPKETRDCLIEGGTVLGESKKIDQLTVKEAQELRETTPPISQPPQVEVSRCISRFKTLTAKLQSILSKEDVPEESFEQLYRLAFSFLQELRSYIRSKWKPYTPDEILEYCVLNDELAHENVLEQASVAARREYEDWFAAKAQAAGF